MSFTENGTLAGKKAARKALFNIWKAMKTSPSFRHLHLSTADEVPCRPSPAAGDTRMAIGHDAVDIKSWLEQASVAGISLGGRKCDNGVAWRNVISRQGESGI